MHHFLDARPAVGPHGPKDVVLVDERTRASGEGGTTPNRRSARPASKTWCLSAKEQGLAGREAPRPTGGGAPHFRRRLHPSGRAPHGGRRPHTSATAPPPRRSPTLPPEAPPLRQSPSRWPEAPHLGNSPTHGGGAQPYAEGHQKRTDAQSVLQIFLIHLVFLIPQFS